MVGLCLLQEVEKFHYLGVFFSSKGKMECVVDRRIGVASAVMMWLLYQSMVVKKELSPKMKLSID